MKEITQKYKYPNGDCFAACVASILEVPLKDLPNYHGFNWYNRWEEFLYRRYRHVPIYWETKEEWPDLNNLAYWIAEVQPTNITHSVVFYQKKFKWDPYMTPRNQGFVLDDVKSIIALYSISSLLDHSSSISPGRSADQPAQ